MDKKQKEEIEDIEEISRILNKYLWQMLKGGLPCRNIKKTK